MHTTQIFYPEGISLFFSNYYYYGVFLALFLRNLLPLPLIYNLLVLHTFVVGGVGAFCLAYYLCGDFKGSLLAGFIFAFSPAHFARSLQHLSLASLQFIPFFCLFLIRSFREEKKSNVLWAALFMMLDALCDWNYLVYDLLLVLFMMGFVLLRRRPGFMASLGRAIWIPVAAIAALSPLLVPMIVLGMTHTFVDPLTGHDYYVADFFGFFVPHAQHFFSGVPWIHRLNKAMSGDDFEKAVYLGIPNLLLVLTAAAAIGKECAKYFLALGVFLILAMGSHPHVAGRVLPFPLPYRILQALPFFTQARCPVRIVVYAYLFLGIIAAFSIRKLCGWFGGRALAKIAFIVFFALTFFDYRPKAFAMSEIALPPCYQVIQADPDKNFGIYELPWDYARYMMHQTIHGIPCVQGYMGRRIERTLLDKLVISKNPGFIRIHHLLLQQAHVKYIIIYKRRALWKSGDIYSEIFSRNWTQIAKFYALEFPRVYADDSAEVFQVY